MRTNENEQFNFMTHSTFNKRHSDAIFSSPPKNFSVTFSNSQKGTINLMIIFQAVLKPTCHTSA